MINKFAKNLFSLVAIVAIAISSLTEASLAGAHDKGEKRKVTLMENVIQFK